MEYSHVPVLYGPVLESLDIQENGIYVDGTLGGGGHSFGICERLSVSGKLIGIDRDTDALDAASEKLKSFPCRKDFIHSNYSEIKFVLNELDIQKIDGALLDLGVSSFQLDNSSRGFSYQYDSPLDMRMDREEGFTAADIVNGYSEQELCRIIREYGEEKWAARIAKFICSAREEKDRSLTPRQAGKLPLRLATPAVYGTGFSKTAKILARRRRPVKGKIFKKPESGD